MKIEKKLNLFLRLLILWLGLLAQVNVYAASTAEIPANTTPKKPNYVTTSTQPAAAGSPVIRVYQDSLPWGLQRDQATLLALGMQLGTNYFVHPMSDLATGIPEGTTVVLITSNSIFDFGAIERQNDPTAQANLDAFVQAGGILIVDMGDNMGNFGGFIAPGAQGTPNTFGPDICNDATLSTVAYGTDGLPGTDDDHPIIKGPDGLAGTNDDLTDTNIDMQFCDVALGNLVDGITLPGNAASLMEATFGGIPKPILAEYAYGNGKIILDTLTKERDFQQPRGTGPSFFMVNLFSYALQLPPPTPPINDDIENAITIVDPLPYSNIQNTYFSTRSDNDPQDCVGFGANVWYQYTPTNNSRVVPFVDGSNYPAIITVYQGSPGNLTLVSCNEGFDAVAGTSYYIAIGSSNGFGGNLSIRLEPALQATLGNTIKGTVTKTGIVTINGTLTCNKPAPGFLVISSLRQTFIRSTAQGNSNLLFIDCLGGGATPWSISLSSSTSTRFGTGRAAISVTGGFGQFPGDSVNINASKTISLTGGK